MRPVARSAYETVPDRIEMDVLHVRAEIPIVPDQVFPVAALPDRLLTPCAATRIAAGQAVIERVRPGERLLDLPPASSIVEIVVRKRPQRMHVVGQDHLRFDNEGPLLLNALDGLPATSLQHAA